MSRVCEITGKHMHFGNRVSHANNKTRRKFLLNLQKRRFFLAGQNRWLTLKVCVSALRTVHKLGIERTLKKYNLEKLLKVD